MSKNGPSWMCIWEKLCITLGMKLIHDGKNNPGQFKLPPEEVRFYTRVYQALMDGELIRTYVKFIYDEREGEVKMDVTSREPDLKFQGHEIMVLGKEAVNAKS